MPNVSMMIALIWIFLFNCFLFVNVKDFMELFISGRINSSNLRRTALFVKTDRIFRLVISFVVIICMLALSPSLSIIGKTKEINEITFFSAPQTVDEPNDKALGNTLEDLREDRRPPDLFEAMIIEHHDTLLKKTKN